MSYNSDLRTYTVREYRFGDAITVWVGDDHGSSHWSRTIHLRIWWFRSPSVRIKNARDKATRKAKALNDREMYLNHELEISKNE